MTAVGLAQIGSRPGETEANRDRSLDAARWLFEQGADIVVLPELAVPWYGTDPARIAPLAEPLDGPTVTAWQSAAAAGGGMVVGGFCERDGDRIYNSAAAVDGSGVVGHYRKLHLFAEEKHCFEPGDLGLPVFETRWGTLGICVCYDLRFVEVVRILALRGADLVCVPTAWVTGFDRKPPNPDGLCPQAEGAVLQANLSQVFIACASQVGTFGDLLMLGSSVLVDPYGSLTAGPLPGTEERLTTADIDLAEAARAQARSPLIQPRADRRTDVYHLTYDRQRL